MSVCWGILSYVCDLVYGTNEEVGDFIFMRDPNKGSLKLYKKTAEEEDEDEEEAEL
jgi:hypothetical protein